MERKKLTDTAVAAECGAQARADESCGQVFYVAPSVSVCRCVLRGHACKLSGSSYSDIVTYNLPCGVGEPPKFAQTHMFQNTLGLEYLDITFLGYIATTI